VSFSEAINIPANYTNIGKDVLDIRVRPGQNSQKQFTKIISWDITSFSRIEMKI